MCTEGYCGWLGAEGPGGECGWLGPEGLEGDYADWLGPDGPEGECSWLGLDGPVYACAVVGVVGAKDIPQAFAPDTERVRTEANLNISNY